MSSGTNSYGHPTPEALCRIQTAGAKVYLTDSLGTISVETNGTTVIVTPDSPAASTYC